MDKKVRVKFTGGREVVGTLKGYDQLVNIVLDDAVEFLRDAEDASILTDATRELGLLVCRGTSVMLVCPEDGTEEISNPFVQTEAAELEGED
ncbi:LSM7 [Symbiodinium sp. KB8]|nr:LSM7 [Symbiodinium sp. KB8]